uniref:F-box protein 16 n=1 Tax=Stegastes partitus TaxID=144197 RepID=A0A3B5AB48_9TELE
MQLLTTQTCLISNTVKCERILSNLSCVPQFDRWSDSQRKAVLQDFVLSCSVDQLRFLSLSVSRRLPLQAADFTCLLPRALCLYIFSFLDPRSLSRCAQVSWHWRSIVELDQLWMPKCLRLGWFISFSPTRFEQGIWKRHYIQTVQELRLSSLQVKHPESTTQRPGSSSRLGLRKEKQLPPWRDSDRHPRDTLRFNYLDNLDPSDQELRADDGERKTLSEANYKLRKAKSLMFLSSNCRPHHIPSPPPPHHHQTQTRPQWASQTPDHPLTKQTTSDLLCLVQWNAGMRPRPVRPPVPQLSVEALRASQRSHRSVPSTPLFEFQPWTVSAAHQHERK